MKTFTQAYEEVKHLQDDFSIDPSHLETIFALVRDEHNIAGNKIVELGSHKGFSTAVIAAAAPEATVLSVDNSLHVPYTERQELFDKLGYKNISVLNTDAESFLKQACANQAAYDVIFHDAAHGNGVIFEYILSCFLLYKTAGMIVIHDWEQITERNEFADQLGIVCLHEMQDAKGRVTMYGWL